jgi:hypothetical protein
MVQFDDNKPMPEDFGLSEKDVIEVDMGRFEIILGTVFFIIGACLGFFVCRAAYYQEHKIPDMSALIRYLFFAMSFFVILTFGAGSSLVYFFVHDSIFSPIFRFIYSFTKKGSAINQYRHSINVWEKEQSLRDITKLQDVIRWHEENINYYTGNIWKVRSIIMFITGIACMTGIFAIGYRSLPLRMKLEDGVGLFFIGFLMLFGVQAFKVATNYWGRPTRFLSELENYKKRLEQALRLREKVDSVDR